MYEWLASISPRTVQMPKARPTRAHQGREKVPSVRRIGSVLGGLRRRRGVPPGVPWAGPSRMAHLNRSIVTSADGGGKRKGPGGSPRLRGGRGGGRGQASTQYGVLSTQYPVPSTQ